MEKLKTAKRGTKEKETDDRENVKKNNKRVSGIKIESSSVKQRDGI